MLPNASRQERFLFAHYRTHVARLMVPFELPHNPWIHLFPAAATALLSRNVKILFHALIAHAAFNLANLCIDNKMLPTVGDMYYHKAVTGLLDILTQSTTHNDAALATVLNLMYAEVYRGSVEWKQHYDGAWALITKHVLSSFHPSDNVGLASLRSFTVIQVLRETSVVTPAQRNSVLGCIAPERQRIREIIEDTSGFGSTIGADPGILNCISRIAAINGHSLGDHSSQDKDVFISDILACLHRHRRALETELGASEELICQKGAFIHATYVFFYRLVFDVTPQFVRSHVSRTFECVSRFLSNSNGNFSFWPAFVAAAEAYAEDDMEAARVWLSKSVSVGLGSRTSASIVLEEVWRRREELASYTGLDAGAVTVDWRTVMQDLGGEVLLI